VPVGTPSGLIPRFGLAPCRSAFFLRRRSVRSATAGVCTTSTVHGLALARCPPMVRCAPPPAALRRVCTVGQPASPVPAGRSDGRDARMAIGKPEHAYRRRISRSGDLLATAFWRSWNPNFPLGMRRSKVIFRAVADAVDIGCDLYQSAVQRSDRRSTSSRGSPSIRASATSRTPRPIPGGCCRS